MPEDTKGITEDEVQHIVDQIEHMATALYEACISVVNSVNEDSDNQAKYIAQVSPKLDKNQIALGIRGACLLITEVLETQRKSYVVAMQAAAKEALEQAE